jgi:hypothetical protein
MERKIILPSEVRRALLGEHARISTLITELEDLAERVSAGEDLGRRFPAVAAQLERALERHNEAEEVALAPFLGQADAWGPLRVAGLLEEHKQEHTSLRAVLVDPDVRRLARAVPRFAADLREHIAHEERTFLEPELLRDDIITLGPSE